MIPMAAAIVTNSRRNFPCIGNKFFKRFVFMLRTCNRFI